ncbi:nucleotidyltransferase [Flavobacterium soyangense]|uniref:Nucleotidyltransferase n=1 Tax=Flavobacterium soyangense TaxID=2023265 RepID=A0A930UCC0_9FLAO|nr:nucleotidyltransferase [Flavobacterium soyangense]MBF2708789.1 nucleotidyltransferase [Flavobacterium soyangense]
MARTINVIQQEMLTRITADENLAGLNTTSKTAIWRLMVFVVAFSIWVLENLFDTHKKEVNDIIEAKMPHRPSWYRTKALAFQYGFDLLTARNEFGLLEDTDKFDNTGYTPEQIEASKVIKYAAVTKSGGQLFIKIATETAGVLAPIAPEVKTAFVAYMDDVADCGVKYLVVNHLPDRLILGMQIYRNPLVLKEFGMDIRTAKYPVEDAIKAYMKQLPFNGELVLAHLVDKLQQVEGVVITHIYNATFQAIDISTGLYNAPELIDVKTVPVAGYFDVGSINESTGEFESGNFSSVSYVV